MTVCIVGMILATVHTASQYTTHSMPLLTSVLQKHGQFALLMAMKVLSLCVYRCNSDVNLEHCEQ